MSSEIIQPIFDYLHGDSDLAELKLLQARYNLILDYHDEVSAYIAGLPSAEQAIISEIHAYVTETNNKLTIFINLLNAGYNPINDVTAYPNDD